MTPLPPSSPPLTPPGDPSVSRAEFYSFHTADPQSFSGRTAVLAAAVADFRGWRRLMLAFVLGGLAILAQPPLHILPVLLISFTLLVWLLHGAQRNLDAFLIGWAFGFGYFVAGIYWIAIAMLTDAAKFGWMIPFAVGGSSAYLAVYPGLAALLTRLTGVVGISRILVFAASWTAAEWVRGVALTGFPWNPIGNVWLMLPEVAQFAALAGVFGLSLVGVLVAAMPAVLAEPGRGRWLQVTATALAVGLMWAGGNARLSMAGNREVPGVVLRLVQPNISQIHKGRDDLRETQLAKHLRLSAPTKRVSTVTHLIWPETATPYFLARERRLRGVLGSIVPLNGLLLTGALRTTAVPENPFRAWNSLHAVDQQGEIVGTYDKFHLVPFGEYVPFRSVLDIAKLTVGATDFSSGSGPRTLRLKGLPPVSPLICYEAIFPGKVTETGTRPGWLLNITNDAWFGRSAGPYQHFASARMRAIEEGLPLVRVANTGISGVVDPYGRVRARLEVGVEGVIDSPLPAALDIRTPFARFGNGVLLFLIILVALGGLLPQRARLLHMG